MNFLGGLLEKHNFFVFVVKNMRKNGSRRKILTSSFLEGREEADLEIVGSRRFQKLWLREVYVRMTPILRMYGHLVQGPLIREKEILKKKKDIAILHRFKQLFFDLFTQLLRVILVWDACVSPPFW